MPVRDFPPPVGVLNILRTFQSTGSADMCSRPDGPKLGLLGCQSVRRGGCACAICSQIPAPGKELGTPSALSKFNERVSE